MIVIILNGPAESGKGTFLEILKELFDLSYTKYSSIAWAKMVAEKHFGWDGQTKTIEDREMIGKIKRLGIEYDDIPFKKVMSFYRRSFANHDDLFVTDVREPLEIEKLVVAFQFLRIKCLTIRIHNLEKEKYAAKNLDVADNQYQYYEYDIGIPNNGTIELFRENIKQIMKDKLTFKKGEY